MQTIRVLAVDNNAAFVEMTADALEQTDETFSVVTETSGEDALSRLRDGSTEGNVSDYDCVISDYDMPGMNGIDLLTAVRADTPDLPFILFTGKGSEEIAAEAISNGVTDYLQKQSGTNQYTLLANRIKNSVVRYRATEEAASTQRFMNKVLEYATDMIAVVSPNEDVVFASGSTERILGYTPEELKELGPFAIIHEDHRDRVKEQFERRLSEPDIPTDIYFKAVHKNGQSVECRARAYNFTKDPDIGGVLVYTRAE